MSHDRWPPQPGRTDVARNLVCQRLDQRSAGIGIGGQSGKATHMDKVPAIARQSRHHAVPQPRPARQPCYQYHVASGAPNRHGDPARRERRRRGGTAEHQCARRSRATQQERSPVHNLDFHLVSITGRGLTLTERKKHSVQTPYIAIVESFVA